MKITILTLKGCLARNSATPSPHPQGDDPSQAGQRTDNAITNPDSAGSGFAQRARGMIIGR